MISQQTKHKCIHEPLQVCWSPAESGVDLTEDHLRNTQPFGSDRRHAQRHCNPVKWECWRKRQTNKNEGQESEQAHVRENSEGRESNERARDKDVIQRRMNEKR